MTTLAIQSQALTTITPSGFGTLAASTYIATAAYNLNSGASGGTPASPDNPPEVVLQVEAATTNAPAGNKQLQVFAAVSMDGTNYSSGPESGTTATDQPDLYFLGVLPINSSSTTERKMFPLIANLGFVPYSVIFVILNDLGVALTSGAVKISEQKATMS